MGLAEVLGLPRSRVSEMISGERKIGASEVPTIAAYLEWPADRLLAQLSDRSVLPLNLDPTPRRMGSIRVVGEVAAGVFKDTVLYEPADQYEMDIPTDPRYGRFKKEGLAVNGPSMNRLYPEGSIVVVVSVFDLAQSADGWEPKTGMRVVVQRINEVGLMEATVKELQIDADGQMWLWPRSDHPQFQQPWKVPAAGEDDFDETNDHLRITALVVGSYRPEP